MTAKDFEPNIFTTLIPVWIKMHRWSDKAHVEYSNVTPRPRLDATLVLEGARLKVIHPLGDFPKNTILISNEAITWKVKKYHYGALYIALGNHQIYPLRYVELLAGTTIKCEIAVDGISILLLKE